MKPQDIEEADSQRNSDHSAAHRLAIISGVLGIGGSVVALLLNLSSLLVAALILLICLSFSVLLLDFRSKRIKFAGREISISMLASISLVAFSVTLGVALLLRRPVDIGFQVPDARVQRPPQIVADSSSCVRELRQQYSCDAFLELTSRTDNLLMSGDRRHLTLDQPIELAVAIGQSKMLSGQHSGANYCGVYEESITEACNTLAGVQQSDLR